MNSLRDKLLKLRSDIARENGQATYLVYNDKELETLLKVQPKSLTELGKIKGFPLSGKRVGIYGPRLVAIFNGGKIYNESRSEPIYFNLNNSSLFSK